MQLKEFILISMQEDLRLAKEEFDEAYKNQEVHIARVEAMTEEEVTERLCDIKLRAEKNSFLFLATTPKAPAMKVSAAPENSAPL